MDNINELYQWIGMYLFPEDLPDEDVIHRRKRYNDILHKYGVGFLYDLKENNVNAVFQELKKVISEVTDHDVGMYWAKRKELKKKGYI